MIAEALGLGAGPAAAQESTDMQQGRGTLGQIAGPYICDPEGSPFRQTSECEVDHDGNVETPTVNPTRARQTRPACSGRRGLGALAPLGLNELL